MTKGVLAQGLGESLKYIHIYAVIILCKHQALYANRTHFVSLGLSGSIRVDSTRSHTTFNTTFQIEGARMPLQCEGADKHCTNLKVSIHPFLPYFLSFVPSFLSILFSVPILYPLLKYVPILNASNIEEPSLRISTCQSQSQICMESSSIVFRKLQCKYLRTVATEQVWYGTRQTKCGKIPYSTGSFPPYRRITEMVAPWREVKKGRMAVFQM